MGLGMGMEMGKGTRMEMGIEKRDSLADMSGSASASIAVWCEWGGWAVAR
jgi:hypothetical protein